MTHHVSRRTLLKGMGAIGASAAVLPLLTSCSKTGTGSEDTLNLVSLYGTSGDEFGKEADTGLKVLETEFADLPWDVKITSFDTKDQVDESVRRARQRIDAGDRFFVGGIVSTTALATGAETNARGALYATTTAAPEITGSECRAGVFQWSVTTDGAMQEVVSTVARENPDAKRWFTVTPDYIFGNALVDGAAKAIDEVGGEHVGNVYHGLDATEFSGFINNARAESPDVLLLLNFGAQATTSLIQAIDYGMKEDTIIVLGWSFGLSQFRTIGADNMGGVYAGLHYWHTLDTPGNKEFVRLFREEFGSNPSNSHAAGYSCGKLLLEGIRAAGSREPEAVAAALVGHQYEGLTGKEVVRTDHKTEKQYLVGVGKDAASMADDDDFMEILSGSVNYGPPEESGCTPTPLGG